MSASDDASYDFAPDTEPEQKPAPRVISKPAGGQKQMPPTDKPAPTIEKLTPRPGDVIHECPFCGLTFNAKGKSRCPECSAPVNLNAADHLQFADPAWVRGVAMGARLIALAMLIHTVAMLARVVQVLLGSGAAKHVKGILHLVAALLLAWAVFALLRPERGRDGVSAKSGVMTRICIVMAAGIWGVLAFLALRETPTDAMVLNGIVVLVCLCQLPVIFVVGFYLKGLAQRLPDDSLAAHATNTTWLLGGVSVLASFLTAMGAQEREYLVFFPISFPIIAACIGLIVWGAVTALRIGNNMTSAAKSGDMIVIKRRERMAARKASTP